MSGVISYLVFFLSGAMILGIAVLGLNLQWGNTGIFNGGVAAFFGAGAYGLIILGGPQRPGEFGGFGLPFPLAILGGILFAGLLAWLVGVVTARLRHDYLAIATFGVAVAAESVVRNAEYLFGGAKGIRSFQRPFEAAINNSFLYNLFFLGLASVSLLLVYLGLERLVQSPFGRLLRGTRENEAAARSLGKSPANVRLQSFVLGSMIMGFAGALYATFYAFVSPQDIAPILTFQIWAMLIVGGAGNNRGALLGTLIVWGGWVASGWLLAKYAPAGWQLYTGTIQYIMIGLIIVLSLLIRPKGLLPEKLTMVKTTVAKTTARSDRPAG